MKRGSTEVVCACGCGERFRVTNAKLKERNYLNRKHQNAHVAVRNSTEVTCACGCGAKFRVKNSKLKERNYLDLKHHNAYRSARSSTEVTCACGCGVRFRVQNYTLKERNYLNPKHRSNHLWRGELFTMSELAALGGVKLPTVSARIMRNLDPVTGEKL